MAMPTNCNQPRMMIITSDEKIIEQIRTTNNLASFETFIFECDKNNYAAFSDDFQSPTHKKSKRNPLICVVCGSRALGRNFGVISCESCKIFFRRNALKSRGTFHCRHNNDCEITLATRRHCSSCRLAKCLIHGMKLDRLLKAEQKAANRTKHKKNTDGALQINDEYEDYKDLDQLAGHQNHFYESNERNSIYTPPACFFQQSSYQYNRALLTFEDMQRIESIEKAFQKRVEFATYDVFSSNSSVYTTAIVQHLNSHSIPAMRLLTFFKQIPEFNQLNVDDKLLLTKYNLLSLFILNSALSFQSDTQQIREMDSDVPLNLSMLRTIHGRETCSEIAKIFGSFVNIRFIDYKIIQLILIVLFLTKGLLTGESLNEPLLKDPISVHRAQNYYTELLWKYMETVHGFEQAVRMFNDLIRQFLAWQKLGEKMRANIKLQLSITNQNELLPLMKSLLHL